MNNNPELEAGAFDHQILERIRNGYIPDLCYCTPCGYFYNNPWRRPEFVALDMGEKFNRINASLADLRGSQPLRVSEVECGQSFITLYLARFGRSVIGIDLSPECIHVANEFAIWGSSSIGERGFLNYIMEDFFSNGLLAQSA